MSASAQPVLPQSTQSVTPGISSSTRIQVVTGQKINVRTSAWPFILIASLLVILTIALPMVLNTQMAQRAYEIRDQQVQLAEINARVETLEAELLIVSSPQKLEEKANAIGLVRSGSIGAVTLETRTVEGGEAAQ